MTNAFLCCVTAVTLPNPYWQIDKFIIHVVIPIPIIAAKVMNLFCIFHTPYFQPIARHGNIVPQITNRKS